MKLRSLPGADFLHLVLQHLLPKGFRHARNYGFLHPNRKALIALLPLVLRIAPRPPASDLPRPAILCPCCGSPMRIVKRGILSGQLVPSDLVQAREKVV